MTLSLVFRKLNGGGPSQAKGGIWVLKSFTGVENMSSAKRNLVTHGLQSSWIPAMERTATHYRVRDYGVTLPSSYYADCQFFGKEIVMAIVSRV